jgi:hypothetical protein
MKTQLILGAAALALAACGGSGKKAEGNAAAGGNAARSAGEKGAAAAGPSGSAGSGGSARGVSLQPGEWETMIESVEIEAPGMPKQVRDMMAKAMGGNRMTITHCVTPQEANRPNGNLFSGKKDANCTYKDFNMAGGRLHGSMTCTGQPGQGSMTMAMDGQFSPQNYTVSEKMVTDAGGSKMTINARVSGRRVGACTADTKEGVKR